MPTLDLSSYFQPQTTTSDGTKYDNALAAVQTAVNGLDNNNITAAAGIAVTKIADPGVGKVVGSGGTSAAAVFPPGYEYGYAAFTATVNLTATTEATANTIITAPAVTFDGATDVIVEFFAPELYAGAGAGVTAVLYDGASSIGMLGLISGLAGGVPVTLRRKITPAAATKTYSIRAFVVSGTGQALAGTGGVGNNMPGYVRITRA